MPDWLLSLDTGLLTWVNELPHPTWLTVTMQAVSTASVGGGIWWLLTLILALRGELAGAFRTALALLLTMFVVGAALKPMIGRDRPPSNPDTPGWHTTTTRSDSASFPSGHAAGAAAGAYSLSRFWAGRPLWAMALVIVASRVYLGAHYPADLLAGVLVGLGCSVFVTGGMTYRSSARRTAGRKPAIDRPPAR